MSTDKARELEDKIADLKARWPAHSVPPSMWQQLEAELEEAKGERKIATDGVIAQLPALAIGKMVARSFGSGILNEMAIEKLSAVRR